MMQILELFPAYAGVILTRFSGISAASTFPRIRGGDPTTAQGLKTAEGFSPHTRG